jgi:hypothetical protein
VLREGGGAFRGERWAGTVGVEEGGVAAGGSDRLRSNT